MQKVPNGSKNKPKGPSFLYSNLPKIKNKNWGFYRKVKIHTVAGSSELKGSRQILQESSSKLSSEGDGVEEEAAMIAIEFSGKSEEEEEAKAAIEE